MKKIVMQEKAEKELTTHRHKQSKTAGGRETIEGKVRREGKEKRGR